MTKPVLLVAAGVLAVGGAAGLWNSQRHASATAPVTAGAKVSASVPIRRHEGWGSRLRLHAMADVAQALGISTATLKTDLQSGDSIATIAAKNHVAVTTVENALLADAKSAIQSAVSAGKMTAAQASTVEAGLGSRIDAWVTASPRSGPLHFGMGPRMGMQRALLSDTATALNMTKTALRKDLQSGQSPAAISTAHGSSAAALISALESDATAALQKQVAAGTLTSTQETALQTMLPQQITAWVNATPGHWMSGGPKGFMPIAMGSLIQDAAAALNMPPSTLESDLRAGQTLAGIAGPTRVASLESTLVKDATADIQSAEQAGRLTAPMASQIESHLTQMVDHMVTMAGHPPTP